MRLRVRLSQSGSASKFGFSGVEDSDFLNPLVKALLLAKRRGAPITVLPARSNVRDGFLA